MINHRLASDRTRSQRVRRPMEANALSIAIGTLCTDGLVLVAERQISSDFVKYYEPKLSGFPLGEGRGSLVLAYAGSPDTMKTIGEKLAGRLKDQNKTRQQVWDVLSETLNQALPSQPDIPHQLLCGFSENRKLYLFKSYNRDVSPVPVWDCLGIGAGPLTRYLGGIFLEDRVHLPLYRAVPICIYMTAQAKKYAPDCGGPTDLIIMTPSGDVLWHVVQKDAEDECDYVEYSINAVLTSATEPGTDIKTVQSLVEALHNVLEKQSQSFMPLLPKGYVLPRFLGS